VNIALLVFDDNTDAIAQTRKLIFVGEVILDIGAAARNHPFKAGIDVYASSEVTKYDGGQQADYEHKHADIENNPLEKPAGRLIEIAQIRNYGHSTVVLLVYHILVLTKHTALLVRLGYFDEFCTREKSHDHLAISSCSAGCEHFAHAWCLQRCDAQTLFVERDHRAALANHDQLLS